MVGAGPVGADTFVRLLLWGGRVLCDDVGCFALDSPLFEDVAVMVEFEAGDAVAAGLHPFP